MNMMASDALSSLRKRERGSSGERSQEPGESGEAGSEGENVMPCGGEGERVGAEVGRGREGKSMGARESRRAAGSTDIGSREGRDDDPGEGEGARGAAMSWIGEASSAGLERRGATVCCVGSEAGGRLELKRRWYKWGWKPRIARAGILPDGSAGSRDMGTSPPGDANAVGAAPIDHDRPRERTRLRPLGPWSKSRECVEEGGSASMFTAVSSIARCSSSRIDDHVASLLPLTLPLLSLPRFDGESGREEGSAGKRWGAEGGMSMGVSPPIARMGAKLMWRGRW